MGGTAGCEGRADSERKGPGNFLKRNSREDSFRGKARQLLVGFDGRRRVGDETGVERTDQVLIGFYIA